MNRRNFLKRICQAATAAAVCAYGTVGVTRRLKPGENLPGSDLVLIGGKGEAVVGPSGRLAWMHDCHIVGQNSPANGMLCEDGAVITRCFFSFGPPTEAELTGGSWVYPTVGNIAQRWHA